METEINSFIEEYQQRVRDCDTLLDDIHLQFTTARRGNDKARLTELRKERAVLWAKRQAYYQCEVNMDSLLDYIE